MWKRLHPRPLPLHLALLECTFLVATVLSYQFYLPQKVRFAVPFLYSLNVAIPRKYSPVVLLHVSNALFTLAHWGKGDAYKLFFVSFVAFVVFEGKIHPVLGRWEAQRPLLLLVYFATWLFFTWTCPHLFLGMLVVVRWIETLSDFRYFFVRACRFHLCAFGFALVASISTWEWSLTVLVGLLALVHLTLLSLCELGFARARCFGWSTEIGRNSSCSALRQWAHQLEIKAAA